MPTLTETQPAPTRYSGEELVARIRADRADPCVDAFHRLWYQAPYTWPMSTYRGVPILKAPTDLQIYHEILWRIRPTCVIETGSCYGGSGLWFAHQVAEWGGEVVSIDIRHPDDAAADHPGIVPAVRADNLRFVVGSSLDSAVLDTVARCRRETAPGPVLVSLDSDHRADHVLAELERYARFVTRGSFLVVEDTNVSGRPIDPEGDPGPGAAVDAWLQRHPEFAVSPLCERFLLTFHPGGWLVRTA